MSSAQDSKAGSARAKARESAEAGSKPLNFLRILGVKSLVSCDRVLARAQTQNKNTFS
jgi:hypothetical protein